MSCGLLSVSLQSMMGACLWSCMCTVNVMQRHAHVLCAFGWKCNLSPMVWLFFCLSWPLRSPRDAVKTGMSQALHLKFLPTDSNHFFIGTNMVSTICYDEVASFQIDLKILRNDVTPIHLLWQIIHLIPFQGLVNHGTSHGLKAPPKFYRCEEAVLRPVDVSSIHFSPFMQHLFLVRVQIWLFLLHQIRKSHFRWLHRWVNAAVVVTFEVVMLCTKQGKFSYLSLS